MEVEMQRYAVYRFYLFVGMIIIPAMLWVSPSDAVVVKQGAKTVLVDRTGERWDISQAVSIGYDPARFEFGIGRYAFQALDDSHWVPDTSSLSSRMRVIGIAGDGNAHAYSVRKLTRHEIANTFLGEHAIVAGY